MSITSDIRTYADNAVTEGKKVLDSTLSTAQAQFNDAAGQANTFVGKYRENVTDIAEKANGAVTDLRASVEKAINVDAIRAAVEPYVAQAKGYQQSVQEKAEELVAGVRGDKRVVQLLDTAGSVGGAVAGTVQHRVVEPVLSLTGRKPARRPAASRTSKSSTGSTRTSASSTTKAAPRKAATTRPAAKKSAAKPAGRSTARSPKPAGTSASKATPRKSPAKKSSS